MSDQSEKQEKTDKDLQLLDDVLTMLRKDFDSIQIFATRHETDEIGTHGFTRGVGNYYARAGLVRQWADAQTYIPKGSSEDKGE